VTNPLSNYTKVLITFVKSFIKHVPDLTTSLLSGKWFLEMNLIEMKETVLLVFKKILRTSYDHYLGRGALSQKLIWLLSLFFWVKAPPPREWSCEYRNKFCEYHLRVFFKKNMMMANLPLHLWTVSSLWITLNTTYY
jgi:hypothetical protein